MHSKVAQSCLTLCDPWTVAHQGPPSVGFSRQEYWSGLPFPSPRNAYQFSKIDPKAFIAFFSYYILKYSVSSYVTGPKGSCTMFDDSFICKLLFCVFYGAIHYQTFEKENVQNSYFCFLSCHKSRWALKYMAFQILKR